MRRNFFIVLVLSVLVYSANFWGYSIYILDEAKNSACAMEMMQRGDWVVPTFNRELRTDKPPLHYFFMMASYKMFGINSFGARFFSVIMGIGTVLIVYLFTRRLLTERAGFYSALVLIASLQVMIQFHLAVPDPYLIFFTTLGLLSFLYAWHFGKSSFYYLFYVSISLAFMAKGPVAVLLAGLSIILFLLVGKQFTWKVFLKIKLFQGALVFLAIVLPWWIAVTLKTDGAWLYGFLFEHNVKRFTSTMEGHTSIPGLALIYVITGLFPFSAFLPQAAKMAWKERVENRLLLFCLTICVTVILFFSFSRTILPSYISPSLPFGAIILGYFLSQWTESKVRVKGVKGSAITMAVIALILPIAGYIVLRRDTYLNYLSPMALVLIICSVGAMVATWFLYAGKIKHFVLGYSISFLTTGIVLMYFVMPALMECNPVDESLVKIKSANHSVVCYRKTNAAFTFNLSQAIPVVNSPEELQQFIKNNNKVTILTRVADSEDIMSLGFRKVYEGKDLFENPVTLVLETE